MTGVQPAATSVDLAGSSARVWSLGSGDAVGYLAGIGGLPRWPQVLDQLATQRRVVAPSLPGFPGGSAFRQLDSQLDWLLAARDLLVASGLEGADLVGVSIGAALAADVAAVWPGLVRRLVLISPLGVFDERQPTADIFAQPPGQLGRLLCADGTRFDEHVTVADGGDPVEWSVQSVRAMESAARLLWPLGDTGLASRLERIPCPALLLFGSDDRVLPAGMRDVFAQAIAGSRVQVVQRAGHLVDLDDPQTVAGLILDHIDAAGH